ncbi:Glycosyltransferases involved in cell wall biogenesis [Alteromonadaceae bacterium Bs31]|nr:Glycosyltransferases involved in cell wall biogenesis [Alteromonadaceae bacterium Bs31]
MTSEIHTPFISVIVPTYNRAHIIATTIENILAQSYKNFELIVVNDGSSDDTNKAIQPYLDKIIYIEQENKGITGARNTGIRASKGEWIALQDSDDYWDTHKLEQQVQDIADHPGLNVYFLETYLERNHLEGEVRSYEHSGFDQYLNKNQFTTFERPLSYHVKYGVAWVQTTLIRREVLFDIGLYDEWLTLFTDLDLFCRLGLKGQWGFHDKPLVKVQRVAEDKSYISSQRTNTPAKPYRNLAYILEKIRFSSELTPDEATAITKRLYNSYSGLGNELYKEGDKQGARDCFRRAMQLEKNPRITIKFLLTFLMLRHNVSEYRPVIPKGNWY